MNIISRSPLIIDYSHLSEEGFMWMHVTPIMVDADDITQGVYGLCRAGAFGRLVHVLTRAGAPIPKIVKVINDAECELTYCLE